MPAKVSQPWIASADIDGAFIIAPAFISLILAFCLSRESQHGTSMPDYAWVALVLLIDVAHVYSTLYRTYFDKNAFQQKRALLTTAPLLAFVSGMLLYSITGLFFWRVLAYLAVFHFVRQQYGFLRIYSQKEPFPAWYARLDTTVIYTATLYPILHWYLTAPKHFNWLIENDFVYFQSDFLLSVGTWAYDGILAAYLLKGGYSCAIGTGTFPEPALSSVPSLRGISALSTSTANWRLLCSTWLPTAFRTWRWSGFTTGSKRETQVKRLRPTSGDKLSLRSVCLSFWAPCSCWLTWKKACGTPWYGADIGRDLLFSTSSLSCRPTPCWLLSFRY